MFASSAKLGIFDAETTLEATIPTLAFSLNPAVRLVRFSYALRFIIKDFEHCGKIDALEIPMNRFSWAARRSVVIRRQLFSEDLSDFDFVAARLA